MRLIDADVLKEEFEWLKSNVSECGRDSIQDAIERINRAPTIGHEHLPIVRDLREKLKQVTVERDSYKIFFEDITKCGDCNDCGKSKTCEFVPKVGQTTRYNCPLWAGR